MCPDFSCVCFGTSFPFPASVRAKACNLIGNLCRSAPSLCVTPISLRQKRPTHTPTNLFQALGLLLPAPCQARSVSFLILIIDRFLSLSQSQPQKGPEQHTSLHFATHPTIYIPIPINQTLSSLWWLVVRTRTRMSANSPVLHWGMLPFTTIRTAHAHALPFFPKKVFNTLFFFFSRVKN